jgi:hypothetical protein
VIEQTNRGERAYDIYSRLLKERINVLLPETAYNHSSSRSSQQVDSFRFGLKDRSLFCLTEFRRFLAGPPILGFRPTPAMSAPGTFRKN